VRLDAEVLAESLEVLVEVEDVDGGGLGGDGHGEVREGEAVGAVGAGRGEIAHRREDARCTERSTGISRRPSSERSTAAIPSGPRASTISS